MENLNLLSPDSCPEILQSALYYVFLVSVKGAPQSLKFFEWSLVLAPDLLCLQNAFHIPPAWPQLHSEPVSSPACVLVCLLSRVRLFVAPWTAARQAPLSMGFSRQECWSGLPFPFSVARRAQNIHWSNQLLSS